jgi:hypothetical protein
VTPMWRFKLLSVVQVSNGPLSKRQSSRATATRETSIFLTRSTTAQLVCNDLRLAVANKRSHPDLERNGEPLHEDADRSELKPRKQMNPCTSLKLNSAYHFPPTELSCGKDQRVPHCRKGWLVGRHGCCSCSFFAGQFLSHFTYTMP